jgi:acetyl-CoA acyltransferase
MARAAMVLAGLPHSVGGVTVNRFCASGLTALQMAADRIRIGEADVMIAGGAESMSMVPMGGNKPSFNPEVFAKDENVGIAYGMGLTAEKVAAQWKVSREDQDAFALASHQKALKAMAAGEFTAEMTPVTVVDRFPNLATGEVTTKTRTVNLDEGARPDTSLEGLAKLKPAFRKEGSVTAGNASGINDGAAIVLLASDEAVAKHGLTSRATIVATATVGCDPSVMGLGPVGAIRKLCAITGWSLDEVDAIEINEAFAVQTLGCAKELGLDPAKLNQRGGAIALGHPIGASGARVLVTLLHLMEDQNYKRGIVSLCIGGGMGIAMAIERGDHA